MTTTTENQDLDPLLVKAIPLAEKLIRDDHFSVENLCHELGCGLKELGDAVVSVDELFAHVNARFMGEYIERATVAAQAAQGDRAEVQALSLAWLDHALENPRLMRVLLQHRWEPGFTRPEWYMQRVNACFAPMHLRLARLAPLATPQAIAAAAHGIYALICGLYFLSVNERANSAGIANLRKTLEMNLDWSLDGLAKA